MPPFQDVMSPAETTETSPMIDHWEKIVHPFIGRTENFFLANTRNGNQCHPDKLRAHLRCQIWKIILIASVVISLFAGCRNATDFSTKDRVQIVAVGDSITWGALAFGDRAASGGYPAILERALQADGYTVEVVNAGIPGEKSAETDDRFLRVIKEADIVLLMIGTNDVIRPESCQTPHECRTIAHIASMIEKAADAGIPLLLSTIPPAQTGCARSWANSPIEALNVQIRQWAEQKQIILVDVYQAIRQATQSHLFSDCLHFTDTGYEIVAQEFYQALIQRITLPLTAP